MKRTLSMLVSLALVLTLCFPVFSIAAAADDGGEAYLLGLSANSPKCAKTDLREVFGDSLTDMLTTYYGLEAEGDSDTFKQVTALSSYSVPEPGYYTAYRTTATTGGLLNKKPDWTQATTVRVEIKLYYTATCTVSGGDGGALYLNGEAVSGSVRLYQGSEYTFSVNPIENYEYALTGAEEDVAFEPDSNIEVSLVYTKLAYATVSLTVGEGGGAEIVSGDRVVSNGRVSEGEGFSVNVTPDAKNGYYLESLTIEKDGEPCEGASVEAVADGESYDITVTFAKAGIEFPDVEVNYVDIEKGNFDAIRDSIISQVSFVPDDFADGAEFEVKYVTGSILGVDIYEELDNNPILPSNHKFGYSGESGELELGNTETVRVTCTNSRFPGVKLVAAATATVTDLRIPAAVEACTVTITYGDDLKSALLKVIRVTDEDGRCVEFDEDRIKVAPESLDVKLLQQQEVSVYFLGNDTYAPAVGTAGVYVRQANASLDVKSETITFGETPAIEVRSDPEDLDYIVFIAGVDGDATGFISIYIPESVQKLMVMDLGFFSINFYDVMREYMKDGVTFAELKQLIESISQTVNADGIDALVGDSGFDIESLRTVLDILSSLPTFDIKAKITLGNPPKNAGVYIVGAATATLNYKFRADLAYLVIKPKTDSEEESVALRFKNEMGNSNTLTYEEAQSFVFGADLEVGGNVVESSNVKHSYFGFTFDGKPVLTTESPIVNPGVYKEIAFILGGNFYAEPIMREYTVEKIPVNITAPEMTVVYDGAPHEIRFTTNLSETEEDSIFIMYSGDCYMSPKAPTNAGTYTVILKHRGDCLHSCAAVTTTLTIEKAPVVVDVYCAETVVYGVLGNLKRNRDLVNPAGLSADVTGLPGGETLEVTPYIVETEEFPHVGTYAVSASFTENSNYDVTVNNAVLKIIPRPVEVVIDDATKVYGDANPAFTYQINDFGTYASAFKYDDSAETAKIAAVSLKVGEKQGSNPNTYAIVAELGESGSSDDYEIKVVKNGVLTVLPRKLTVTIDSKSKVYGEDDPELTYTVEGALEGDELNIVLTREPGESAGTYAISGTASNSNYIVSFAGENGETGVFTIKSKTVIIKVISATKTVGDEDPEFEITVEDEFGNPIDPESIGLVISREAGEEAGTYRITVLLENGDYTFDSETFVGGELTIEPEKPAAEDNPNTTDIAEETDNTGAVILWVSVSVLLVCMLAAAGARVFRRRRLTR